MKLHPIQPLSADRKSRQIYFELILKKGLLSLPRFLLALAVTGVILLVSALAMFAMTGRDQLSTTIPVGIVIPEGDMLTSMGAGMLAEMESVKSICSFQYLSEEQADAALSDGTIQAAIYLTRDLYQDINSGVNTPIRILIPRDSTLGVSLFRDLVTVGVSMLQVGEAAVYSLEETADMYEVVTPVQTLMDDMAMEFVSLAMSRNAAWDSTLLSEYGSITMTGFYLITAILAFLSVFFGIGFSGLYEARELALEKCLSRKGIGAVSRSLARLFPMTAVLFVLLSAALSVAAAVSDLVTMRWYLLPALLPAAFCLACFIHMIHSLTLRTSGCLFYLLVTVLMFIMGSSLFPASSLPRILRPLPSVLPVHVWQKYLSDVLWNGFSLRSFLSCLLTGLVMAGIGALALKSHEYRQ
ncbi:MAG: ABC transporter permease [Blautia sp.]|nr:ABC transporter permease [Blautia sp.]